VKFITRDTVNARCSHEEAAGLVRPLVKPCVAESGKNGGDCAWDCGGADWLLQAQALPFRKEHQWSIHIHPLTTPYSRCSSLRGAAKSLLRSRAHTYVHLVVASNFWQGYLQKA